MWEQAVQRVRQTKIRLDSADAEGPALVWEGFANMAAGPAVFPLLGHRATRCSSVQFTFHTPPEPGQPEPCKPAHTGALSLCRQ